MTEHAAPPAAAEQAAGNAAPPPAAEATRPPKIPLPPQIQHALALKAQEREVMAELSRTNWGEKLDVMTRKAIADWGMRHGIDVAQEIDILGNRIYLNAKFYLRGLAHLVQAGRVEYVEVDHVENDARLSAFPVEQQRRLALRIQYGLPDHAIGACVARVKLMGVPVEFNGAQWCGGRGKHKPRGKDYEVFKDPIGEERPIETAETRALRRCLRLMVTHIPAEAAKIDSALEDAENELSGVLDRAREVRHLNAAGEVQRQIAAAPVTVAQPARRDRVLVPVGEMPGPYVEGSPAPTAATPPTQAPDPAAEGADAEPAFQDDRDLVND